MKIWNSFSSEKDKCVICNKVTYDYVCYKQNGLEIKLAKCPKCNFNTFIVDDIKIAFSVIKNGIRKGTK